MESGTDPALVAGWIVEVQGARLAAERELVDAIPPAEPLSEDELRAIQRDPSLVRSLIRFERPELASSEMFCEQSVSAGKVASSVRNLLALRTAQGAGLREGQRKQLDAGSG